MGSQTVTHNQEQTRMDPEEITIAVYERKPSYPATGLAPISQQIGDMVK